MANDWLARPLVVGRWAGIYQTGLLLVYRSAVRAMAEWMPNDEVARRAGLPLGGVVQGIITLIQEHRFRVEDADGRGYLFTLGPATCLSARDLHRWSGEKRTVMVDYKGPPDLGAVAVRVRPR